MATFANLCISSGALRRLRSFTLATDFQMDWVKHVVHLLSDSPLENFQIHSGYPLTDEFWTELILTHGKRLLLISAHRTLISWEATHSICVQCTKLEQLFLVVSPDRPDHLVRTLVFGLARRTHILISCAG